MTAITIAKQIAIKTNTATIIRRTTSPKYYTSFYDKTEPRNDILDTFRPMKEVVLGEIQ